MKENFLKSILGNEGAEALLRAVEYAPHMAGALYPLAAQVWSDVIIKYGHSGFIPGTTSSLDFDKLSKSGTIINQDITSKVTKDTLSQIIIDCIGLGEQELLENPPEGMKKALEVLVKAQVVSQRMSKTVTQKPIEAAPAYNPYKNTPKESLLKRIQTISSITFPVPVNDLCSDCGTSFFKSEHFVGCICTRDTVSLAQISTNNGNITLNFKEPVPSSIAKDIKSVTK